MRETYSLCILYIKYSVAADDRDFFLVVTFTLDIHFCLYFHILSAALGLPLFYNLSPKFLFKYAVL